MRSGPLIMSKKGKATFNSGCPIKETVTPKLGRKEKYIKDQVKSPVASDCESQTVNPE